ncbi:MAG: peptide/nickel transport system substrate-binding protein [Chloroflexota bacterium]|jgi:peptide/nickel transport system substrate-binding protein|nr:peptide/nickel transport system substrate-binding protein [Chloroflexota bacterium]
MLGSIALVLATALAACSQGQPVGRSVPDAAAQPTASQLAGPRGTLKVAWGREPETLSPKFLAGAEDGEYQWTFNSALTVRDLAGEPHPVLAREIPTQENGDFVINPDGTMVTTYRLRAGATWHDGTPITAGDYVFAHEVYLDKNLPIQQPQPEPLMSAVEAKDDYTLVISWREPFLAANTLGYQQLNPLPRHVLEAKYRNNHDNFAIGEEWTTAYVGTGPFRVERWTRGSGLVARAHPGWALGPPKLDTLEIRFIPDANAQMASLLSGAVDMVNSPTVRSNEAAAIREQWNGQGYVTSWVTRAQYLEFQFRQVPNWQRAVTDVRVRQALLSAVDRQALADTINLGFGGVADAFIVPTDPLYPEVEQVITKYPLDLNRSSALLAEAGWQKPAGGGPAVNAAGQTLDVELWTTTDATRVGEIVVNNWKGAGVNASTFGIPAARARDGELRSSFPAANVNSRSIGPDNFVWTTSGFPTPANRFVGSNRGSFSDPEVDRLQKIRLTSFDPGEQKQATVGVLKRMTELVGAQPMIYAVEVIVARNSVHGPVGNYGPQQGITWNIQDWEVS